MARARMFHGGVDIRLIPSITSADGHQQCHCKRKIHYAKNPDVPCYTSDVNLVYIRLTT